MWEYVIGIIHDKDIWYYVGEKDFEGKRLKRCPKCKKEFTEYPALSREDNETKICPERGVREAIEAYQKPPCKGGFMLAKDEFHYTLASFRGRFFDIFFSP